MPSQKNSEKLTYTVPEAGEILGVGRSAAYEGARTGEIPTIKIGKRILVPKIALERKLEKAV
jgi:excisionase family DNA binding protein